MTISDIRKKVIPILKKEGVLKAAIFGSYATGYADPKSDIDFLIQMNKNKSLFDLAGLKIDLEEKLGKKVDVLTYKGIHPLLRRRILGEKITIYEKK